MARLATLSSQQCTAGPSNTSKRAGVHKKATTHAPSKRTESYLRRSARVADVGHAKKKNEKIKQVAGVKQGRTPARIFAHVYVGNLDPIVTEPMLKQHFSVCGKVRKATLRISRGQAITVGHAVPANVRTTRDRKYATLEFYDSKSALNALRLNNTMLAGSKMLVCAAAGDLPEVADIARPHLQNIHIRNQQHGRPQPRNRPKPLTRQDTEQDFSDPKNDRIRIFGFSFDKCIV